MGYVKSPCINICKLDENKICIGCYRTIDEIAHWTKYTDEEKIQINRIIETRKTNETF
jgi:predicted Fe-S protein YdhL (DUF1289 family)